MIISDTSTAGAFEPCPPGTHPARCVRLLDLGTQTADFQGESKTARKLQLTFEILDGELFTNKGRNFTISKKYTASLHEKAALRAALVAWRGRDFTPEELRAFDMKAVLGAAALASVVQLEREGKTFSTLASISKPPKGLSVAAATEPLLHWDMSAPEPNWAAFDALPQRLQEVIAASPEFKRLVRPGAAEVEADIPF